MDDYIAIATLNDYIFCPYSIYLHNVYIDTDEGMYKATPQIKGTLVHEGVDHKTSSTKKTDIFSIHVKTEIFKYVQQYYRCFMGKKSAQQLPNFVYQ